MKKWQKVIDEKTKKYLEGYTACHDYYHHVSVLSHALKIARKIKCDQDILWAAAMLHDVGYKGFEEDDRNHFIYSINLARKWLKNTDFPKEKIEEVSEVIRLHDNFSWGHNYELPKLIETKILQDADRIEALGAIGIVRICYYHGEKGHPIYNPAKVKKTREVWLNHSIADQIQRDLLKKYENLNFEVSKKMFRKRFEFSKIFERELKREFNEAGL